MDLKDIPRTTLADEVKPAKEKVTIKEMTLKPPEFDPKITLQSPDSFTTYLEKMILYVEESNSVSRSPSEQAYFLGSILRKTGRPFLTDNKNAMELLNAVEKNPNQGDALLSKLTQLTELLHETSDKRLTRSNGEYVIAAYSVLSVGWQIATRIDQGRKITGNESIAYYGMDDTHLRRMYLHETGGQTLKNRQLEKDYDNILAFFNRTSKAETTIKLFNYEEHRQKNKTNDNLPCLRKDLPEIQYASVHANQSKMDWKEAYDLYSKLKTTREFKNSEDINNDFWRNSWYYVKGKTPDHFNALQKLAMMAHFESPHHEEISGEKMELQGPLLGPDYTDNSEKKHLRVIYKFPGDDRIVNPEYKMFSARTCKRESPFKIPEKASLPQGSEKLSFGDMAELTDEYKDTEVWSRVLLENPTLTPTKQNIAVSAFEPSLHKMQTIRTACREISDSTLGMPMLVDYYKDRLFLLTKQHERIFFAETLYQPMHLSHALETNPDIAKEVLSLLENAENFFNDQIDTKIDVVASREAFVFILEQKTRFLQWLYDHKIENVGNISTKLSNIRKSLKGKINDPNYEDLKLHLSLIKLDSYNSDIELSSDEQIIDLMTTHIEAKRLFLETDYLSRKKISPILINTAFQAPFYHQEEIRKLFSKDTDTRNKILTEILKFMEFGAQTTQWTEEAYPIYRLDDRGTIFQLDILSGTVRKNGKSLAPKIINYREDSLYKTLFGHKYLTGTDYDVYTECVDSKGSTVRLYDKDGKLGEIHRKIHDQWYAYIPIGTKDYPTLPSFPQHKKLDVYKDAENKDGSFLIIDRETLEPKYRLNRDGTFSFPIEIGVEKEKQYELVDKEEHQALAPFDPNALIWKKTGVVPPHMFLQFPTYYDEQNNLLEFEKKPESDKWIWKAHPHLFLSKEQILKGVEGYNRFLVLESEGGEKEVLLAMQTYKQTSKGEPDGKEKITVCYRTRLEDDKATSKSPKINALLAYLSLAHATAPEHYVEALQFLKQAYRFEGYTDEELKILGWIFNVVEHNHDNSVQADAVRLYTAWLVHDNLKRTLAPPKNLVSEHKSDVPDFDGPSQDWVAYWHGKYTWQKGEEKFDLKTQTSKLSTHYLTRRAKAEKELRIENVLDPQELIDWQYVDAIMKIEKGIKGPLLEEIKPKIQLEKLYMRNLMDLLTAKTPKKTIPYLTRPDEKWFKDQFRHLYEAALSDDPKKRQPVKNLAEAMQYYPSEYVFTLRTILLAVLARNQPITRMMEDIRNDEKFNEDDFKEALNVFYDPDYMLRGIEESTETERAEVPIKMRPPPRPAEEVIPKAVPIDLSKTKPKLPKINFDFKKEDINLDTAQNLYKSYLDEKTTEEKVAKTKFNFPKSENQFVIDRQQAFSDDYEKGCKLNEAIKQHKLKKDVSIPQLVDGITKGIKNDIDSDTKEAEALKNEILEIANRLPEEPKKRLLKKAAISAGQETRLTIDDCIALFLISDPEEFKKRTELKERDETNELYNKIGSFLLISRRKYHYQSILKKAEKINGITDPDRQKQLIQDLGDALNITQEIDFKTDHPAMLVFQYYMNLYLKKHQVEGIRDMLPDPSKSGEFPSILLQRIMGGGKTLVFGHVMALMKADGYHLSVHVPPTPLYGTALYDMMHISNHVFRQNERTLTFDDHPARFNPKYLNWMKNTLEKAIVDREYVTMTSETIRAMRCKYIKTQLQINELLEKNAVEDAKAFEASNQILGEILGLLKDRGIFTLDEVHQALDPRKELNMPYGPTTSPDPIHAKITSKVIRLAASAKDEKGNKLLNIKSNQQSQQKAEQFEQMKTKVIDDLLDDEKMHRDLGLTDDGRKLEQKELDTRKQQVKKYILNKEKEVPSFLEEINKKALGRTGPAYNIVYLRQLFVGNWLGERLNKSVNEHHGFSTEAGGVKISIPYSANMRPSEGSEFSDQYVMMINTLIAYVVNGLDEKQIKQCIEDLKFQAQMEYTTKRQDDPTFSIKKTRGFRVFEKLTKLELFKIDIDDAVTFKTIQKGFDSDTDSAFKVILSFAEEKVLSAVNLYDKQICTHGQNMASMAKTVVGYSGSLDNTNMAPIGTTANPELGTNGQTVDLLTRQNNEIWITTNKPDSLFENLINHHPQKKDIRAIIDVGAHFRGIPNREVAEKICQNLKDSVQGVLFFDDGGRLCFMHKNTPKTHTVLSGTRPETIEAETGYLQEHLFTYYDQDHITGTDISQKDDAVAVLTCSEHTKLHEILQGSRRMRGLHLAQRVVFAVQEGSLEKIGHTINKELKLVPSDKPVNKQAFGSPDLMVFTDMNEIEDQQEENLLFALQKIENSIQQLIFNKSFKADKDEKRKLWAKAGYLFSRDIAIDLWKEYAYHKKTCDMGKYLTITRNTLLEPLKGVITDQEYKNLGEITDKVIKDAVKGLEKEIEVSQGFEKQASLKEITSNQNKDASFVQFREQEAETVTEQKQQQQQETEMIPFNQNENTVRNNHILLDESEIDSKKFQSPDFGIKTDPFPGTEALFERLKTAQIWTLNDVVQAELGEKKQYRKLFTDDLLVTSNFCIAWNNRTDLLSGFKKDAYQMLLIKDGIKGKEKWKLALCTIEEAKFFEQQLQKSTLPKDRDMWLIRPPIKPLISNTGNTSRIGESSLSTEVKDNPEVQSLIVQSLLIQGDLTNLRKENWSKHLATWLGQQKDLERYRDFFEKEVLKAVSEGYKRSRVYKVFRGYQEIQ